MIRFGCPRCKQVLEAPDDQAGAKVNCPTCGQRLQIPVPPPNKTILAPLVSPPPEPAAAPIPSAPPPPALAPPLRSVPIVPLAAPYAPPSAVTAQPTTAAAPLIITRPAGPRRSAAVRWFVLGGGGVLAVVLLLLILAVCGVFRQPGAVAEARSALEAARLDRAKSDIKALEAALETYHARHGDYPVTWEPLMQPGNNERAILEASSILDPWNWPYTLDTSQRHPATGRPKIYSRGADGNTMISNW